MSSENASSISENRYRIRIESAVYPAYADLTANYGAGNVSEFWDENKHSLELHESLRDLAPPPSCGEVMLFLKRFDRATMPEEAIKWAYDHNGRPVFPWEREALSKIELNLPRKFSIVDTGSFVLSVKRQCIPLFYKENNKRCLGASLFNFERDAGDFFLFADK